ncbi:uncharacterized protein LOC126792101 [Argentina anserina]|uniref:uncharacterized protein LOC126792101 n=1 Tax=Argentina anserina TaxID=57926 RepID=UPI002176952F|nr:uncharacterized protein LOC126792101 [Potentilla anserina]
MANIKGFEVVYSKDEDNMSIYSACSEDDSSEEYELEYVSEEEDDNSRKVYLLQVENWGNDNVEEVSSYGVKPEVKEVLLSQEERHTKIVSTSRFSNDMEVGLKFPGYKMYHLHAFVDTGSAIPQYKEEDHNEFKKDIAYLLEKGLIRSSNNPHHAPAFYVRNHAKQVRGKERMVIDYRDVNRKTIKDGYQIAKARVLINRLKRAKVFSKFDVKSRFLQIKMHPDSISLIAFGTLQEHYEWLVM